MQPPLRRPLLARPTAARGPGSARPDALGEEALDDPRRDHQDRMCAGVDPCAPRPMHSRPTEAVSAWRRLLGALCCLGLALQGVAPRLHLALEDHLPAPGPEQHVQARDHGHSHSHSHAHAHAHGHSEQASRSDRTTRSGEQHPTHPIEDHLDERQDSDLPWDVSPFSFAMTPLEASSPLARLQLVRATLEHWSRPLEPPPRRGGPPRAPPLFV